MQLTQLLLVALLRFKLFRLKYRKRLVAYLFCCAILQEFEGNQKVTKRRWVWTEACLSPFERHCLGKEEVKSNDWIRLYVELALAATEDRDGELKFNLKIVNVATDLLDGGLNARNATFYIRFLDKSKGEESDCIACVRRRIDEKTGCFILVGQTHPTSDILSKKRKFVGGDSVHKRTKTGDSSSVVSIE